MQTAAVALALALRSAIADVQAAVEAVDEKVSDIQKKVRAREVGEVVGTYRYLQRVVDATRERGKLLEADWDQVAGARRDLEIALGFAACLRDRVDQRNQRRGLATEARGSNHDDHGDKGVARRPAA